MYAEKEHNSLDQHVTTSTREGDSQDGRSQGSSQYGSARLGVTLAGKVIFHE